METWEGGNWLREINWNDLDQQRNKREVGAMAANEYLSFPIHTELNQQGKGSYKNTVMPKIAHGSKGLWE